MKKLSIFLFVLSLSFLSSKEIYAAKKFVPKASTPKTYAKRATGNLPAVVKYRGDKLAILLSFSNFSGIESVNYTFTYDSGETRQGAAGTIRSNNNPESQRELLFGTCSKGVCTYHHNLSSARLILTGNMTNGRTVTKSYRIKTYQ